MDSQALILLASLCFLSIFFILSFKKYSNSISKQNGNRSDHLRPYPLLGNLPQFVANRHRIHDWVTEVVSGSPTNTCFISRLGGIRGVVTANPANVEHVLRANFDNFPKGPRFRIILHDFLGHGIFNADGHLWRVQRKTASFEFNTRSLRAFVVGVVQQETAARLLPLLHKCADEGRVIDIQEVLERYAFDNVCRVAFNEDPACLTADGGNELSGFADAFRDAAELSAGRFRYMLPGFWRLKKLFGLGSERRLKESISTVHEFATEIIRSRLKEMRLSFKPRADDLLSRFIALEEDHSEEFLRDIVISFILAGRETTSSALTWFFWLLSTRPDVRRKILEEISSVRARRSPDNFSTNTFEYEELRELHFLHAAITESMRLYPPVPLNMTRCLEDDVLPDGTEIKKGWFVSYNSYAMGRMEAIWGEDCREYKPERWLDDNGAFQPESPFKFVAFHAGPRMCLGKEMAYIQMKSIAASVLVRFVIEPVKEVEKPEQSMSLTLRMKSGLAVRVKDRLG